MCGILGYIGSAPAEPILLEGLKRVEYRGYDSAGIASLDPQGHIELRRAEGKLTKLVAKLEGKHLLGTVGIGHTRWATHGKAVEKNAHPHVAGKVAVVHNGIVENYLELREELEAKGCSFKSDTDTEVVSQLINFSLSHGFEPLEAVRVATGRLTGSFALAILFEGHEDFLVGVRKGRPMVVGFGDGGSCLGSDELSIATIANRLVHLKDGDIAVVSRAGAEIYDLDGSPVVRAIKPMAVANASVSKGDYRHFMLKEIFEQPAVIGDTLRTFADPMTHRVLLPSLPFNFKDVSRLSLIGCGTASHAGLVAQYWFESLAKIPTDWYVASEFRYRESIFVPGQAGLFVSQSGETADTLAAIEHMKISGCPTLALVNVRESSMTQIADAAVYTSAGPEIGVASTKAFTTQLAALASLTVGAAREREVLGVRRESELIRAFDELPTRIQNVLELNPAFVALAEQLAQARDVFYIGRGTSYAIALEGSLKLKETSYLHAEAYAAGELKHGPLALIDKNVPVIAIAPRDHVFDKTASNIQEIVTRGGKVILLSDKKGCDKLGRHVSYSVALPDVDPFIAPILYSVAVQLLAYHTAVRKGTDVDQPRNLAKSVTVE